MKKLTNLMAALVILLSFSGKAQAVPMYYTFEGTVEYAYEFSAGLLGGLAVGDSLSYTMMMDFDVQGTITAADGTTYTYSDGLSYVGAPNERYYDYFYTDYIGGSALMGGSGNTTGVNYGYEIDFTDPDPIYNDGVIAYGDTGDYFYLYRSGSLIENFVVGTTGWTAMDEIWGASGMEEARIESRNMVLVSISDTNPYASVPEPSTLILLASGMLGLLAFRKRQLTIRA